MSSKEAPWEFPCLGKSFMGDIVLFTKEGEGTLIKKGESGIPIGLHARDWNMEGFDQFHGEVFINL